MMTMKECHVCNEQIQDSDVFCPHCGEHLIVEQAVKEIKTKKPKWYFKNTSWIVGFFFVGPFILPVVWANPRYSVLVKLIITSAVLIITFGIIQVLLIVLSDLDSHYTELLELYN